MHDSLLYIGLIAVYFIYFWWDVIKNPYSIASGESIDYDYGSVKLTGEYWRKGKIPRDPYYFKKLDQVRPGTYYPPNILFAFLGKKLDTVWLLYVVNLLLHNLGIAVLAYFLFGQGLIGLFGALAWGFCSYHIKCTLWYSQLFFWITASILCIKLDTLWLGPCLGMMILSGHAPFIIYFHYILAVYYIFNLYIPWESYIMAIVVGFPQIQGYWKYRKICIKVETGYKDKIIVGNLPWWTFLLVFLPIRVRDFVADVGYEEWLFYVTPLVVLLALFSGNLQLWLMVLVGFTLSTGMFWKQLHRFMFRWPYRWGYFSMLALIMLSVEGLQKLALPPPNMILILILLSILLLYNRESILLYPLKEYGEKPSKTFDTFFLWYLSRRAKGFKVNNLPYPVYSGQVNHVLTQGYTGGNHIASLGKYLGIPKDGFAPYNWFDWKKDGKELDKFGIGFHVGKRPSKSKKWRQDKIFKNLWINENIVS